MITPRHREDHGRRAIIDIGSNSVRLVVFGGPPRAPVPLFNEKLMAGLGRGVISTGRLDPAARDAALAGLKRFAALVALMDVTWLRVVATAAVREAADGAAFLDAVRALGLPAELLDGDGEAVAAGYGALSEHPGADGIVADLGGGSLELVRVQAGTVGARMSLPLGVLRVPAIRATGKGEVKRTLDRLTDAAWVGESADRPLYLVGGSWRALARVHMARSPFPLPIVAGYSIAPTDVKPLAMYLKTADRAEIRAIPGLPAARADQVGDAASLLNALVTRLRPSQLVICAYGLREGLLFEALDPEQRMRDPLLDGVRFAVAATQPFAGYAQALMRWMTPLFGQEDASLARLRHAAVLLRGTGWATNHDFRASDAVELALHGQWAGIDVRERAIIAAALFSGMGGRGTAPAVLGMLADEGELARAATWGLAMRVAQAASGGAPRVLEKTALAMDQGSLVLSLPQALSAVPDNSLRRRMDRLAAALSAADSRIQIISD